MPKASVICDMGAAGAGTLQLDLHHAILDVHELYVAAIALEGRAHIFQYFFDPILHRLALPS